MRPSILQQALDYDKQLKLSATVEPTVSSNPAAAINQLYIPKAPDDSDVGTFENVANRFLIGMDETQKGMYDKLNIDSENNQGMGKWIESVMGQDFLDDRIKANELEIDENLKRIKHFNELAGDVGIIGKTARYFEEELPMILGSSFGLIGSSLAAAAVGTVLAPGVGTAAGLAVAGAGLASSRYMESLAEASGTYRETLARLEAMKKRGDGEFANMSTEEMKRRALTASDENFKENMKLMVMDVPQLLLAYAPIAKVAARAIGMGSKTFASGSLAGKLAEKSAYTAARYPGMGLIKGALVGGIEAAEEGVQFSTNDAAIARQTGGKAMELDELFKNEEFQKSLIGGFAVGGFMKGLGAVASKINDLYKTNVKKDDSTAIDAFNEEKMKTLNKDAAELQLTSLYNWWERGQVPSMFGTLQAAAEKGQFNDKKAVDQEAETKSHVERIKGFKDNYTEMLDKYQATISAFPELQEDVESVDAKGKTVKTVNPLRKQLFLINAKMHNIETDLKEVGKVPVKNNDYVAFQTDMLKQLKELAQDTIDGKDVKAKTDMLETAEAAFEKNKNRLVEVKEEKGKKKSEAAEVSPVELMAGVTAPVEKTEEAKPAASTEAAPVMDESWLGSPGTKAPVEAKPVEKAEVKPEEEEDIDEEEERVNSVSSSAKELAEELQVDREEIRDSKGQVYAINSDDSTPEVAVSKDPDGELKKINSRNIDPIKEHDGDVKDSDFTGSFKQAGFVADIDNDGEVKIKNGVLTQPRGKFQAKNYEGRERSEKTVKLKQYTDKKGNKYLVGFQTPYSTTTGKYKVRSMQGSGYLIPVKKDGTIDGDSVVMMYRSIDKKDASDNFLSYSAWPQLRDKLGLIPEKAEAKKETVEAKTEKVEAKPSPEPDDKPRKVVQQALPLDAEQKGQFKVDKKDDGTFDLVGPDGVVKNYKQKASAVNAADRSNKKAIAEGKGVAKEKAPVKEEKKEEPKEENNFVTDFNEATPGQKHSVLSREISLKGGKIKATISAVQGKGTYFAMNIGLLNKIAAYLGKKGLLPKLLTKENGFLEASRTLKIPQLQNEDGTFNKIPDGWKYELQSNKTYTLFDNKGKSVVTDINPNSNTEYKAGIKTVFKAKLSDGRIVNLIPEQYSDITLADDGKEVELALIFPRAGEENVHVVHGVPVYMFDSVMYANQIAVMKDGVKVSNVFGGESISMKQEQAEQQRDRFLEWLDRTVGSLENHRKTSTNDVLLGIPMYITELALKAFRAVYKSLKGNQKFSSNIGDIIYDKMKSAYKIDPELKVDVNDPAFIESFVNTFYKFRASQLGQVINTPEIVTWYEANSGSTAEYLQAWEKRMKTKYQPMIVEVDGKYDVMLGKNAIKYRPNEKAKEEIAKGLTKAKAEKALSAWKRKQDSWVDMTVKKVKESMLIQNTSLGTIQSINLQEALLTEEYEGLDNDAKVRKFQIENNMASLTNRVRIFFKIPGVAESNVREELLIASRQLPKGKKKASDFKQFYTEHPSIGEDVKNYLRSINLPDAYYVSLHSYIQSWSKERMLYLTDNTSEPGLRSLVQNTVTKQKLTAEALAIRYLEFSKGAYLNAQEKETKRIEDWKAMLDENDRLFVPLKAILSKKISEVPGLAEILKDYQSGNITINRMMQDFYANVNKKGMSIDASMTAEAIGAIEKEVAAYVKAIELISEDLNKARAITQEMMNNEMKYFEVHTGLTKEELLASAVSSHHTLKNGNLKHEHIVTMDSSIDPVIESGMLHMLAHKKNLEKHATLFLSRVIQDYNKGKALPSSLDFLLTMKGRKNTNNNFMVSLIQKVASGMTSGTEMILSDRYTSVNGKGADGAKLNHLFERQSKLVPDLSTKPKFEKNGFVQLHANQVPVIEWIDGMKVSDDAKKIDSFTSDEVLVMMASFYMNRDKTTGSYLHPIEILGDRITQMAFVKTRSYKLENAKAIAGADVQKEWNKSKVRVIEILKENKHAFKMPADLTIEQLAEELFYNYAVNKVDVDAVYHGPVSLYGKKKYEGKVKRSSQSASTGNNPVMDIEGGLAEKTRIVILKDKPGTYHLLGEKEARTRKEVADGTTWVAERYSDQTAVSTGELYHFDGTIKAQINEFDPLTDNRFLLKSNWVVLTEKYALDSGGKNGDLYKIWKLLNRKENPVDIVAFDSGAKVRNTDNDLTVNDLENLSEDKVYLANSKDIIYQQDLRFDVDPTKMEFQEGEFPVQLYRYLMQFPEFDALNTAFLTQQHEGFVQASRELLNARSLPYLFVNFLMKNLKDSPEDNFIREILVSSENVHPDEQTVIDYDQLVEIASEDQNFFLSKKELVIGQTVLLKDPKDQYSQLMQSEGVLVKITDTEEGENGKTKYTIEIVDSKYTRGGYGFEQNKINNPIVRERIMGIVGNYVSNKAIQRKINRFALQEVTSYGIEGDATLKNARVETVNGKKVLSPGQAYIPESLKSQCIERDGKKYLFIIRVPTTEMHSVSLVEVIGFLPNAMHNSIITDLATQSKAGADADGDQRFSMSEYKGKKLSEKQINSNKIIQTMLDIFTNPDNQKSLDTPIDLDKIRSIVTKINPQDDVNLDERNITSALKMWDNNADAKKGVGIAARTLGVFQYFKKWNATIKHDVTVGGIKLKSFKAATKAEDQLISEELANLANVIVDNANETLMLPLGLTQSTTNFYFALRMLGLPADQITYMLTKTEVGKFYVENLQKAKSILNAETEFGVTTAAKKEFNIKEDKTNFEIKKLSKASNEEIFHLINFAMKVSQEMYRYSEMMKINEDGILNESDFVSALKVLRQTKKISAQENEKNKDYIVFPKDEFPITSRLMVPFRMALDAARSTYKNSVYDTVPGNMVLDMLASKYGSVDYKKVLRALKRVALSSAFGITDTNVMKKEAAKKFYDTYIAESQLAEYLKFNTKIELVPGLSMKEAPQGIVDEITNMISGLPDDVQMELLKYHVAHYGWSFNVGFARAFPTALQNVVGQRMGEIQSIWKQVDNKTSLDIIEKIVQSVPSEVVKYEDAEAVEKRLDKPVDISFHPLAISDGQQTYVAKQKGFSNIFKYELVSVNKKGDTLVSGVVNRRGEKPEFDKLPFYNPATKTKVFAGIGSREMPESMRPQVRKAIAMLKKAGYHTLRGGRAPGADITFEEEWGQQEKEIFVAEELVDGKLVLTYTQELHPKEYAIAKEIHPKWASLTDKKTRALMARNTNQIFGAKLDTPVDFVLCWTQDGATTAEQTFINTGGTGQAIRMASLKGIPVINMLNPSWEVELEALLNGNLVTPVIANVKTQTELDADQVLGKVKVDNRKLGKKKVAYMPLDSDAFFIGKGIYVDDKGTLYEVAKASMSIFNGRVPSLGTIQRLGYSSLEELTKDNPRVKDAIENGTSVNIYRISKRGSIPMVATEDDRISSSPALDGIQVYKALINNLEVAPGQENNLYVKTDTGWVIRKSTDIVSEIPFGKHNIIIVISKDGFGAIEPVTGRIVATNRNLEALQEDVFDNFLDRENGLIDLGEILYQSRQEGPTDTISPKFRWMDGGMDYQDAVTNEAKASEDVAFQNYVREELHKLFPDVAYFTDANQFQAFLDKNFPGEVLDLSKLGAAIQSAAVYINPQTAVQSSQTHEYGHIYFDMLPEGRVKNAIRKAFVGENGAFDEEAFVILLGQKAVAELHEKYKGKSTLREIIDLLKDFWSIIKIRMNKANKSEIVRLASRKMLRGKKTSGVATKKTTQGLKYMTGNKAVDIVSQQFMDMHKSYTSGPYRGQIRVDDVKILDNLDAIWGTNIDIDRANMRKSKKTINGKVYTGWIVDYTLNNATRKVGTDTRPLFGVTKVMQMADPVKFMVDPVISGNENVVGSNEWKMKHVGNPMHTFLENVVLLQDFDLAYAEAVNNGLATIDKDLLKKNVFDPMMKRIKASEAAGEKMLGEVVIGNENLNVNGRADLVTALPNGTARISDYKTSETNVYDSSGNLSAEYTKSVNGNASKEEKHNTQLDIYAYAVGMNDNDRKEIEVSETELVPIKYTLKNGEIIAIEFEKPIIRKTSVLSISNAKDIVTAFNESLEEITKVELADITEMTIEEFSKPYTNDGFFVLETQKKNLQKEVIAENKIKNKTPQEVAANKLKKDKLDGIKFVYNTIKKKYEIYKKELHEIKKVLGTDGLAGKTYPELIVLYQQFAKYTTLAKNTQLGIILGLIREEIVRKQMNEFNTANPTEKISSEKDITKLDVLNLPPSQMKATQPILRMLAKSQLEASQRAQDNMRTHLKELEKLDIKLRKEWNENNSDFWTKTKRFLSKLGGYRYYENMWEKNKDGTYSGNYKKLDDASLTVTEKEYLTFIFNYKSAPGPGGAVNPIAERLKTSGTSIREANGGIHIRQSTFEVYARLGFYKAFSHWLKGAHSIDMVNLYVKDPNTGIEELTNYRNVIDKIDTAVRDGKIGKVNASILIERYTRKAKGLLAKGEHDTIPGIDPLPIGGFAYRTSTEIEEGKAIEKPVSDYQARTLDNTLELRSRFFYGRSKNSDFSLDIYTSIQQFIMEMEYESAMTSKDVDVNGEKMSVMDMAIMAQITYQTKKDVPHAAEWLEHWVDKRVFGKASKTKIFDGEREWIQLGMGLTHLTVMTFNPWLGASNLIIGLINNVTFGNATQYFKNSFNRWGRDFRKCLAILREHKIVNYKPEVPDSSIVGWFAKASTAFISLGEMIIQNSAFISRIPDDVWNNMQVNADGGIDYIDPLGKKLTTEEISKLKIQSSNIQGRYGEDDKRNYHNFAVYQLVMQFKTWLPDVLNLMFGGVKRDVYDQKQVGIMSAVRLWMNWIFQAPRLGLAEANANYQKFNSLEEFKRAQKNAAKFFLTIGGLWLISSGGDDDDEKKDRSSSFGNVFGKSTKEAERDILRQFAGLINPSNLVATAGVPAYNTVQKFTALFESIITAETYEQNSVYGVKGEYKAFDNLLKAMPYKNLLVQVTGAKNPNYRVDDNDSQWDSNNFD